MSASPASTGHAPDHLREATKDAPIGGQAVLEGVMMRGVSTWAVAVRKPTGEQLAAGGAELAVNTRPPAPALARRRLALPEIALAGPSSPA